MSKDGHYPKIPPQAFELLIAYNHAVDERIDAERRLAECEANCEQIWTTVTEEYPHLNDLRPLPSRRIAVRSVNGQPTSSTPSGSEAQAAEAEFRIFLKSPDFRANRNPTEGFLDLLKYLCKHHSEGFESVPEIDFGGSRKCIARNQADLGNVQKGVRPRPIPDTKYWADANNDLKRKGEILRRVLQHVGYGSAAGDTAVAALAALRDKRLMAPRVARIKDETVLEDL